MMARVAFVLFGVSEALYSPAYSTNAICRQSNCINPIFPGVDDLRRLEATQLQCQPMHDAKQHMQFCKNAVFYDVALPSPKKSSNTTTLESVVLTQDDAASTMYHYHLAGMNVEAWDHRQPDKDGDKCIQAVWKMVCNTYFPRAEAGCKQGEPTKHLRPCKNTCGSYIQACNVECCDESVQCVFSKQVALLNGSAITTTGYHDELGPSATCTGAASRKSLPSVAVLFIASLGLLQFLRPGSRSVGVAAANGAGRGSKLPWARLRNCAMWFTLFAVCTTLQGCMLGQVFSHPTPTWEQVPNYWEKFQFIPEGAPASKRVYNSCDLSLPARDQCSGHGECQPFRLDMKATASTKTMTFCKCYRDWADPECRTQRKSQASAFFMSVFLGFFGADQFYLGHYITGAAKAATLSGVVGAWYFHGWWILNLFSYACGMWWVFDIVRIGSAPIYSTEYRVAYDLPHWAYVTFTLVFFSVLGYIFFGVLTRADRFTKAKNKFLVQENEHKMMTDTRTAFPEDFVSMPTMASYGVPMPVNYGAVPDAVKQGSVFTDQGTPEYNRYSAYGVYSHTMQGYTPPGRYDEQARPRHPEYEAARMANGHMHQMGPMGYGY